MEYINQFEKWAYALSFLQVLGLILLITASISGLLFFLVWFFSPKPRGEKYSVTATVEEKAYAPSRRSSGAGIGVTSGGQVGSVATSSYTPQSFNVVFITDTKDVIVANDKKAYGQLVVGQKVRLRMQPYRYFGKQKEPQYVSFEII